MAAGLIAPTHIVLAFLLLALAIGHLCAALFYHFAIRRDQILQRMVPGTQVSVERTIGSKRLSRRKDIAARPAAKSRLIHLLRLHPFVW